VEEKFSSSPSTDVAFFGGSPPAAPSRKTNLLQLVKQPLLKNFQEALAATAGDPALLKDIAQALDLSLFRGEIGRDLQPLALSSDEEASQESSRSEASPSPNKRMLVLCCGTLAAVGFCEEGEAEGQLHRSHQCTFFRELQYSNNKTRNLCSGCLKMSQHRCNRLVKAQKKSKRKSGSSSSISHANNRYLGKEDVVVKNNDNRAKKKTLTQELSRCRKLWEAHDERSVVETEIIDSDKMFLKLMLQSGLERKAETKSMILAMMKVMHKVCFSFPSSRTAVA
jgi:hypothetical protein